MPILGVIASSRFVAPAPAPAPPVTSGLIYWYDGADSSTMTESGGNISRWDSKSPASSATYFEQPTGARQPNLANNVKNGRSAVQFVRANTDTLESNPTTNPFLGSAVFSIVMVCQGTAISSPVGSTTIGWGNFNSPGQGYTISMRPTGDANSGKYASGTAGGFADHYVNSTSTYDNTWVCLVETVNGTALTQRVNETDSNTATATSTNIANNNDWYLGQMADPWYATAAWSGYIGDVLIYNRVLTAIERTDMYTWAQSKWAL